MMVKWNLKTDAPMDCCILHHNIDHKKIRFKTFRNLSHSIIQKLYDLNSMWLTYLVRHGLLLLSDLERTMTYFAKDDQQIEFKKENNKVYLRRSVGISRSLS